MSRKDGTAAMLDLWRPPQGAGDPVGCLATTYTFDPGLFDEQCLARFLGIESEPNREDLAFLLERESRLGCVYAGVLVDYTMAGVEHSLRWDVLPVRIRSGKQHAKLSLLAWSRHVRIIVASSNLSEPGYRTNYEVVTTVDLKPESADLDLLGDALDFLGQVVLRVPGAGSNPTATRRAEAFLSSVHRRTADWIRPSRSGAAVRQQLAITLPSAGTGGEGRSSLTDALEACRKRGGSPDEVWVASPFFDLEAGSNRVVGSLCKAMARGTQRNLRFCVPAIRNDDKRAKPRLAAPKALWTTPQNYQGSVRVEMLPFLDGDKNHRPWHAKMLALQARSYSALMIGSSNFTAAGMGVPGFARNIEANLVTVIDRVAYGREVGALEAVWPECEAVANPEDAEWLGTLPDEGDENQNTPRLPEGFVLATYRAGDIATIELRLSREGLPSDWQILACSSSGPAREILSASSWGNAGRSICTVVPWSQPQPPDKLEVRWDGRSAFMPLNVEDARALPRPAELGNMSANDMLQILAATDPSAAFRTWAKRQAKMESFDGDLDSATPVDLDPLRRYDLQQTFLHRIRNRARVFMQLRQNLERPVWGLQALEWRLRGLVGVEPLADLYLKEFNEAGENAEESLLTLADYLLVLSEVDYQHSDGMLAKSEFSKRYSAFVKELAQRLQDAVSGQLEAVPADVQLFWGGLVTRCLG